MDMGYDIPYIGGSKYYGKGVQETMDRRFDIPFVWGS
jgi:hypothetical protein